MSLVNLPLDNFSVIVILWITRYNNFEYFILYNLQFEECILEGCCGICCWDVFLSSGCCGFVAVKFVLVNLAFSISVIQFFILKKVNC